MHWLKEKELEFNIFQFINEKSIISLRRLDIIKA